MQNSHKTTGFSLVELSIVLVILGLLVGGVLGGQALIKAAEQRALLADLDKYKASAHTFRARYDQYPGDFSDARRFWPQCVDRSSGNRCNGNGNGFIGYEGGNTMDEGFRAFEHMALAGVIEGQYTQEFISISYYASSLYVVSALPSTDDTSNLAHSRYKSGAVYHFHSFSPSDAYSVPPFIQGKTGYIAVTGTSAVSTPSPRITLSPLFTSEEAFLLDRKIDDGDLRKGGVVGSLLGIPLYGCSDTTLNDASLRCGLFFQWQ